MDNLGYDPLINIRFGSEIVSSKVDVERSMVL